jgi:hypothetical protein
MTNRKGRKERKGKRFVQEFLCQSCVFWKNWDAPLKLAFYLGRISGILNLLVLAKVYAVLQHDLLKKHSIS